MRAGTTLAGPPETVARGIEHQIGFAGGSGPGGLLFRAHEWADRAQPPNSHELFARWVMRGFQGLLRMPAVSRNRCADNREGNFAPNLEALRRAFSGAGQAVPDMERLRLRERRPGAQLDGARGGGHHPRRP